MKIVSKKWGCEIWWADTDKYLGKILIINPGCSTSLHYHEDKDETILVTRGVLHITNETSHGKRVDVGQTVHVAPKDKHRLTAMCTGAELIEVSTPHPDDSVGVYE